MRLQGTPAKQENNSRPPTLISPLKHLEDAAAAAATATAAGFNKIHSITETGIYKPSLKRPATSVNTHTWQMLSFNYM